MRTLRRGRALTAVSVLLVVATALVVLPKIITGHCLLHELGLVDRLGYDPLHELSRKIGRLIEGR